jgi:hypothetical protein
MTWSVTTSARLLKRRRAFFCLHANKFSYNALRLLWDVAVIEELAPISVGISMHPVGLAWVRVPPSPTDFYLWENN